jgi:ubiquinone/menaquinone biosynthesis C-methylase UbiE
MKFFYSILTKTYEAAAKKMCRQCSQFIKKGSKTLDLGCGSAIVANEFKKFFSANISGVDIVDKRVVPISFALYDGKNLDFTDNFFDVVLINFVLHHCEDPVKVLQEAKRVAKDKIIIYEDLPENIFSKAICQMHGKSFAWLFGNEKESCNFKTGAEWRQVFKDLGLKLIFEKKVRLYSKIFVLEK